MEFNTFQLSCRFSSFASAYRDDHTRMEIVCNRDDRRPDGHSWGICDEAHCPYFGIRIAGSNAIMYDSQGAEVGRAERIEIAAVLNPEDYE